MTAILYVNLSVQTFKTRDPEPFNNGLNDRGFYARTNNRNNSDTQRGM
jgi:hypothetical protein